MPVLDYLYLLVFHVNIFFPCFLYSLGIHHNTANLIKYISAIDHGWVEFEKNERVSGQWDGFLSYIIRYKPVFK